MKIFNILLALTIWFQSSQSFAHGQNIIQESFNRAQYEIETTPNLNHIEIKAMAIETLQQLKSLGVEDSQIINYLKNSIKDNQRKKDFDQLLGALKKQNASTDVMFYQLNNFFIDTYNQGASFMSQGPAPKQLLYILLVFTTMIAVMMVACPDCATY